MREQDEQDEREDGEEGRGGGDRKNKNTKSRRKDNKDHNGISNIITMHTDRLHATETSVKQEGQQPEGGMGEGAGEVCGRKMEDTGWGGRGNGGRHPSPRLRRPGSAIIKFVSAHHSHGAAFAEATCAGIGILLFYVCLCVSATAL